MRPQLKTPPMLNPLRTTAEFSTTMVPDIVDSGDALPRGRRTRSSATGASPVNPRGRREAVVSDRGVDDDRRATREDSYGSGHTISVVRSHCLGRGAHLCCRCRWAPPPLRRNPRSMSRSPRHRPSSATSIPGSSSKTESAMTASPLMKREVSVSGVAVVVAVRVELRTRHSERAEARNRSRLRSQSGVPDEPAGVDGECPEVGNGAAAGGREVAQETVVAKNAFIEGEGAVVQDSSAATGSLGARAG